MVAACVGRAGRPQQTLVSLDAEPSVRVRPLEYRWGEGAWQTTDSLHREPPGRNGERKLTVRFVMPSSECPDPTLYLSSCVYIQGAKIGAREVTSTSCFIPYRHDEAGQPVELYFESSQRMREGEILAACQSRLRQHLAKSDAGALWVSFTLLVGGAFLGLLAARGGSEARVLATAAAFCVGIGLHFLQQTNVVESLLPVAPALLRAARDVGGFVYPPAMTAFIGFVLPVRAKPLLVLAAMMGVTLCAAIVLDLAGVVSLRTASIVSTWLIVPMLLVVVFHLARNVKTDPAARKLLAGLSLLVTCALPDLVWGMTGLQLVNQNTGYWGLLPLVGIMAWVLQDRFRANAAAMRQRVRDIEALNEELRFQVESRSRELGAAVAALPPPVPRDPPPGEIIAERYRVEELLGKGGMAQVYRVARLQDGRRFALKVLTGRVTRIDAARFAREAELAARLRHENLVPVVDVGLVPGGPIFLVMELVDGVSLDKLRERWGDPKWAMGVLADIARGLGAIHAAGIVHRDLKPPNVMIGQGRARITDFGVARPDAAPIYDEGATATRGGELTQTGALIGTPRYMAPEVVRGDGASRASDVFSFGLIAFELLTARFPLVEPPYVAALGRRPIERAVPAIVPSEPVRELLWRTLDEQPDRRPPAHELLSALERAASVNALA